MITCKKSNIVIMDRFSGLYNISELITKRHQFCSKNVFLTLCTTLNSICGQGAELVTATGTTSATVCSKILLSIFAMVETALTS
jgi:hypothetical protein